MKPGGGSGSLRERCGFHGIHELIAFHGDSDFPWRDLIGPVAAKNLSETTDANGRIAAGKSDEVLDPPANFNFLARKKTYSTRTDVACLFCTVYLLGADSNNL